MAGITPGPRVRSTLILVPLVCLALALSAWAGERRVRVSEVFDGDTVRLTTGESLRLEGLDTPETAKDQVPAQYYAREAWQRLRELVTGRELTLELGRTPRDVHGRLLGRLRLPDGTEINETLVADGLAFVFPHTDSDPALLRRLLAAQRTAMDAGRGFWPRILALPAAAAPALGNRRSGRFFPQGCPEARDVSVRNRVSFAGATEAFRAGFAPARPCGFWPGAGME